MKIEVKQKQPKIVLQSPNYRLIETANGSYVETKHTNLLGEVSFGPIQYDPDDSNVNGLYTQINCLNAFLRELAEK